MSREGSIKKLNTNNVNRLDSMQANKVGEKDDKSNLLISENTGDSKDRTAGDYITSIQEEVEYGSDKDIDYW